MDIFSKIASLKNKIIISALVVFVLSVFIGVIFILTQEFESSWGSDIMGVYKAVNSLIILAIAIVILVDNLRKISNDDKKAKVLGLCSLIFGPICLVLGLLLLWEIIPTHNNPTSSCLFCDDYIVTPTIFVKLIPSMVCIEALFFLGSNVFSIKDNGQKTVNLIKTIAMVFLVLGVATGIYSINMSYDFATTTKVDIVSKITLVAFISTTATAFLTSKSATRDEKAKTPIPEKPSPEKPDKPSEETIEEQISYNQVDYNEMEGDQNNAV